MLNSIPTIGKFLSAFNYQIAEGSKFYWTCYGDNAWCVDTKFDPDIDSPADGTIVYDTLTRVVYQVELCVDTTYWRWVNPHYTQALEREYQHRGIPTEPEVDTTHTFDEIITQARQLTTTSTELTTLETTIEANVLHELMSAAHTDDVTLNELLTAAITDRVRSN